MSADGKYSPLRQSVRIKKRTDCVLRLVHLNEESIEAFLVETLDYSNSGLGIIFDSEKLSIGNRYFVYIEALNIIRIAAEIVWLKPCKEDCKAGLRWL